jgi:SAM-dependent methyltransferase
LPVLSEELSVLQCPLCAETIASGQTLVECNHVHPPVLLSWPWKDEASYMGFYADSDYHDGQYTRNTGSTCGSQYEVSRKAAAMRFQLLCAILDKFDGVPDFIDVGAGNMAFVDEVNAHSCNAWGIDPHPLRDDCLRGTWADVEGKYDIITMYDVFEHLTEPSDCLKHLKNCLKPRGVLVVEMPEYKAPHASWARHIKPQEHISLYSAKAAEAMYENAGFDIIGFHRPLQCTLGKMCHFLQRKYENG